MANVLVESLSQVVYNTFHGLRGPTFLPVLLPQLQDCTLVCSEHCGIHGSHCPLSSGGGLAQLGEHYVRNVGVGGSTPLPSTKSFLMYYRPHRNEGAIGAYLIEGASLHAETALTHLNEVK